MRYLNTAFQWADLGTGLGTITGTTTAAYAIVGGNIVRLDAGNVRTTVRAPETRETSPRAERIFSR